MTGTSGAALAGDTGQGRTATGGHTARGQGRWDEDDRPSAAASAVPTPGAAEVAGVVGSGDDVRTYYGVPVLHEPVWKDEIGWYLFTGGLAGASSVLAAGAELVGARPVARAARVAALAGIGVSPFFLIRDLGRPERAANMLRVVRPTSPMSVGSWLLTLYGPLAGGAALSDLFGVLPRLGRAAGFAAAALGPGVATYTGVLVGDTAVPAWHDAGRILPFLFAASAASSAGGAASAVLPTEQSGMARRLAVLGAASEVAAAERMIVGLGELGKPYHEGTAGRFQRLATVLGVSSAALLALGGRRRWATALGGAAGLAGAACQRFAVLNAGRQSARDPKATVGPQRRRLAASGQRVTLH